jgi:ketosteroid isomerase-like protein
VALMLKPDDIAEKAVAELNRQWMRAYAKGDLDFLEKHMSEDYVGTFPDGTVLDKKGEIEAVKSGTVKILEMTPKEMTVRTYGNTAVITGQSHIEAVVGGQAMSANFRFTDVWVAQDGSWRAVASQVTRIEDRVDLEEPV